MTAQILNMEVKSLELLPAGMGWICFAGPEGGEAITCRTGDTALAATISALLRAREMYSKWIMK